MLSQNAGRYREVAVIPDAYFSVQMGNRRAPFFLELDRATMSTARWNTRVKAYMLYLRTGKYTERYHSTSLRILTLTTTPRRMLNLMQATMKAGGTNLFWFTTFDQVNPTSVFFAPIWLLANDEPAGARKALLGCRGLKTCPVTHCRVSSKADCSLSGVLYSPEQGIPF